MSEQDMWNLDGWARVPCLVANLLRAHTSVHVLSSLTDPAGQYGPAVVYTEWGDRRDDTPVLREYRFPDGGHCDHYVPWEPNYELVVEEAADG